MIYKKGIRGFTLIELLLAMLIISIVVSFSLPYYGKYIRNSRLEEAKAILIEYASYLNEYYNDNNRYTDSEGRYIDLSYFNDVVDIGSISQYFLFSVNFDIDRGGVFTLRAEPREDYKVKESRYIRMNQYNNIFICQDVGNKSLCK